MTYEHIRSVDVEQHDSGVIKVRNLRNYESYEAFSVAEIDLNGDQKFGRDPKSDVAYYVLEGQGKFFIENEEIDVKAGDLIFIEKNTKYKDSGKMKLLAIASPRFERDKRIRVD